MKPRMPRVVLISFIVLTSNLEHPVICQGLGNVSHIELKDETLLLSVGSDVLALKPCTPNILMINFRPDGVEDPDTLVVGRTLWSSTGASIDTSGDPISIRTTEFNAQIDRNPLRIHLFTKKDLVLFEEPDTGGIHANRLDLVTSGGIFYGIHNRSTGTLNTQSGGTVSAGNQGQAGGPFVWSTKGWGFLADADGGNISITSNSFSFTRPASPTKRDIECYFLFGNPKEIIKGFNEITGMPPMFPKYTLGFLNTEWGIDQAELYSDIHAYRDRGIPVDAYILDFDWMDWGSDNFGEFRWGPKFPDGQSGAIVDTLTRYGMKLMGIRKPRVHVSTVQGQYAQANGFFVDYVTDYFSGKLVGRMNFNKPEARKWYWESFAIQNNSYAKGITGYWNDEADEYGGNLMFMQMQRAQYEGQRAFNNKRVWSINRNYYSGAQRYAYALWSGDIQSGFSSLANQRLFMLSSVVLGASWWGMDIGGFQSTPSPENYFRWIQCGTFVPVFRVHGTYNEEREPWYFGELADSIATKYIRLRYRLLPYVYAAAWENHLTGNAIARPLVIDYPLDANVQNLSSEWMFGNSLLVSPVVSAEAVQQSVYLPEGVWYDFISGQTYSGKSAYNIPVSNIDIPTFVKGGSIIPMSPEGQSSGAPEMQKTVILSSYPGGSGSCLVYDDDGESYDYEQGILSIDSVLHDRNTVRAVISIGARSGLYVPPSRDWRVDVNWLDTTPDSVLLNGKRMTIRAIDSVRSLSIIGWGYDPSLHTGYARFPDDGSSAVVVFYFGKPSSTKDSHGDNLPKTYELLGNYPNPFNPSTTIRYALPSPSRVKLTVFTLLGQRVSEVVNEDQDAGIYDYRLNELAEDRSSGLYFYRMDAVSKTHPPTHFVGTGKMLLIR